MNMNKTMNRAVAISDYTETALNVAQKLHYEYFFNVPENFDETLFKQQFEKITQNYEYLTFAVGILLNALTHIESEIVEIKSDCEIDIEELM